MQNYWFQHFPVLYYLKRNIPRKRITAIVTINVNECPHFVLDIFIKSKFLKFDFDTLLSKSLLTAISLNSIKGTLYYINVKCFVKSNTKLLKI